MSERPPRTGGNGPEPLLVVAGLDAFYGPVQALHELSLVVHEGEVVTLVGANGAGKSTLLRTISGVVQGRGELTFAGADLLGRTPEAIARRGVAHIPEGRKIFPGLTVVENLEVAAFALGHPKRQVREDVQRVLGIFPGLAERRKSYGWSLSGGEQQMLAIGRGLMARPRLLLLDEPSLGLAPILVEETFGVIEQIRSEGTTILLVEQNAAMALSVADRGYVLETGRVVKQGPAAELFDDEAVIEAYLGGVEPES
jgi:branched-chain amino acid transport system ATP-binding protein